MNGGGNGFIGCGLLIVGLVVAVWASGFILGVLGSAFQAGLHAFG